MEHRSRRPGKTMTTGRQAAMGHLIAGALNMLPWDASQVDPGCCVVHCGPCYGLKWFKDHAPELADLYVEAAEYHLGGWVFWDDEAETLNWGLVQSIWDRHQGCALVDGVYEPCKEEEDGAH